VSDSPRQRDEAVAAYLLGELGAADRAEFERRLAGDRALREEIESLRPVVSTLGALPAEAWDVAEPPPLHLPEPEPGALPARRPRFAIPRWAAPRVALAGGFAALLLGAGIAIGTLIDGAGDDADPAPATTIALTPVGPGGGEARGELTVAGGAGETARLKVSGLPPNGEDYYEAWLLGDRGLVSLGAFRVGEDEGATVELQLPVDPERYGSIDVSLEPDDGDPAHSTDSVLRGTVSS
jgi:hypothetical protein